MTNVTTPLKLETAKLVSLRPASSTALLARIEGGPPALYGAGKLPGLSISIRAAGAGPFPAALASQPERPYFEVLVARDDPLGEALAKVPAGGAVEVSEPFGAG